MNELSDEQQAILEYIKLGNNVVVDAVAGTGKTTMILSIARALPNMKILQFTYNSSLKDDVRKRALETGLDNIEIHTFHSFMPAYYLNGGFNDSDMRKILSRDLGPYRQIPKFDILVLDECQDMSFLYFQFIAKIIRDGGLNVQLLVLGDYMQGLYDFKGADIRFLTMAKDIWVGFPYLRTQYFELCTMKMSFRITNQMCCFVNEVMLGEDRMKACRDGPKVTYIRYPMFDAMKIIYGEILKLFDAGIKPDDIFVLSNSVKGTNSKIMKLENSLVERGIPCHVPMLDGDKIDDRVIGGKVVFSTFHTSKGRQRRYVFIVGFDHISMRYQTRGIPENMCPNTLYVGATRALEGLYLIENDERDTDQPLKFLKKSHIEMKQLPYTDFRGMHKSIFKDAPLLEQFKKITPTELIKFIPDSVIEELSVLLDKIFIQDTDSNVDEIDITNIAKTKDGLFEEVSDLNGIAIPAIYYDHLNQQAGVFKKSVLLEVIDDYITMMKDNEHIFLRKLVNDIPETISSIDEYLYVANVLTAVQEKLYFKVKQINKTDYNWLDQRAISKCLKRLRNIVGKDCDNILPRIEETIIHYNNDDQHEKIDKFLKIAAPSLPHLRFSARIDTITKSTVWEMKCTKTLTTDHKLQVVIYAWLMRMRITDKTKDKHKDGKKSFKLFNIRSGELLRLEASMDELNHIMLTLLKVKFQEKVVKTDEDFINDCRSYLASI